MASPAEGNKYILITNDMQEFEVDEAEAFLAEAIKNKIENGFMSPIPLYGVDAKTFTLVAEFLRNYAEMEKKRSLLGEEDGDGDKSALDDEIKAWNAEFMGKVDTGTLINLFFAASDLNIESLLDLFDDRIENYFHGKTVEEVCEIFKRRPQWAFQ